MTGESAQLSHSKSSSCVKYQESETSKFNPGSTGAQLKSHSIQEGRFSRLGGIWSASNSMIYYVYGEASRALMFEHLSTLFPWVCRNESNVSVLCFETFGALCSPQREQDRTSLSSYFLVLAVSVEFPEPY